jgi:hypothetical protein
MLNFKLASAMGLVVAAGMGLALPTVASAQAKMISGSKNGFQWQAQSRIIGQTPTSDVLPPSNTIGGGDPIYFPTSQKSGVVALIMTYDNGNRFICSGSLVSGNSIATAGHCVSSGGGVKDAGLVSTKAYFFKGDPNERTPFQTGGVEIDVTGYFVHPDYTGEVIDQNDIAILRLASSAPKEFERYALYTSDIKGEQFNVAGYGTRSTVGGAEGNTGAAAGRTGFLREGDNIYDYAWGDSLFEGFFTDVIDGENFFGTADIEFSYISDFDNGLAAQSQATRIANALGLGPIGTDNFNDLGLGAREVGIAGGDSGGPGFVDGKLASINSYGLTFGPAFGDFGGGLNSGWGEFSGYVPVFIHTDFIAGALTAAVPEPGTWGMLIVGFGVVGFAARRRRATGSVTA